MKIIINRIQLACYAEANWKHETTDDNVMVLHTLVVDPLKIGKGMEQHLLNTTSNMQLIIIAPFYVWIHKKATLLLEIFMRN